MSFWSDIVQDIKFIGQSAAGSPAPGAVQGNVAGLAGTEQAGGTAWTAAVTLVEGIWTELTDGRMWRSLGWIVLGIILMLLGVAWWIGPSAERASPVGIVAEGLG